MQKVLTVIFVSLFFFVSFLSLFGKVYAQECYDETMSIECREGYEVSDDYRCGSISSGYKCCCLKGSASLSSNEIPNPTALESIGDLITKASSLIPPFAILGFVGSVIYAGFVRMTAAGNPEKEAKSMKIAIAAAIGFAIIALAPLLVNLISGFLNVEDPLA